MEQLVVEEVLLDFLKLQNQLVLEVPVMIHH